MNDYVTVTVECLTCGEEHELELNFDYSSGYPARMYMPNGDPGYPGSPEEVELCDVEEEYELPCGHTFTVTEKDKERWEQEAIDHSKDLINDEKVERQLQRLGLED